MIITLNITEDSKVELVKDNCEAVQGEHNVTILNINFPTTIKGYSIDNYAKQIEFAECKELGECVKFLDVLEGNIYKLCSTCTQFEKLMIQFTLKNLVDEAEPIVWKTIPFMLEFCESINAENNKEVQVTLLSLAEIKAEWANDLSTTKNEWEAFIKANALRMVYKVGNVPTPDATSLGDTIFYLGANSTEPYTLTYGHYYRCNLANGVYEWTDLIRDPNLADVANGIREINNNQTMQFWVGTKEELGNEVPQNNVLYVPQIEDDDGVLRLGDIVIPQVKLIMSNDAGVQNYTFSENIAGRTFEILFNSGNNDPVTKSRKIKLTLPSNFIASFITLDIENIRVVDDQILVYKSVLTCQPNNMALNYECYNISNPNNMGTPTQSLSGFIYKIYEVIE